VDGPASFQSEVDWRTGGTEGLWLLDGLLWVPTEWELAGSCRKYVESKNLSLGMIYTFHVSKQEWNYVTWNKLSVTSLEDVFLTTWNSPSHWAK
jgi:hypothetical protein